MTRLVHYDRIGVPIPVDTVEELDALLDRIAASPDYQEDPVLVDIGTTDKQQVLQIGVGRTDCSVLIWYDWRAPEVLASVATLVPAEPLAFNYGGTWTELRDDAAVPVAVARTVAREFVGTAGRPTSVQWREKVQ